MIRILKDRALVIIKSIELFGSITSNNHDFNFRAMHCRTKLKKPLRYFKRHMEKSTKFNVKTVSGVIVEVFEVTRYSFGITESGRLFYEISFKGKAV